MGHRKGNHAKRTERASQHVVFNTAFSPDGRLVVTASFDRTARVWDAATGIMLAELRHQSLIPAAAFSPDGQRVVTASADRTARVWDISGLYLTPQAVMARIEEILLHLGRSASPDECRAYFSSSIGARPKECENPSTGSSTAKR